MRLTEFHERVTLRFGTTYGASVLADHVLQAALRYLENGQVAVLLEVVRLCPEILQMCSKGT